MPIDFTLTFPLRLVLLSSKDDDPKDATVYCLKVDDLLCAALFTDNDLLERHFFRDNDKRGKSIKRIDSVAQLGPILRGLVVGGIDGVVFDPGRIGGKSFFVYSIADVLEKFD